jgi:hypothetical protein
VRAFLSLGAGLAVALQAGAGLAERACFISYAGFEERVPHLDLDTCPGHEVKPEEGFCRIALNGDTVHVYLFRHQAEAEPCLAQVDRYEFNDFAARFGISYEKP